MKDGKAVMEDVKTFEGAKELNMKHSAFQEAVSITRQEGDTKDPNEYLLLASTFYNESGNDPTKLIATLKRESSVYKNGNPSLRFSPSDNSTTVLASRAGLLHRLTGGADLTNGSTQNDGNDFFAWGLTQGPFKGGKHAKFREYQTITISKDIFNKVVENLKNLYPKGRTRFPDYSPNFMPIIEGVFIDPSNFDTNGNFYYKTGIKNGRNLVATATAGATIYWKVTK